MGRATRKWRPTHEGNQKVFRITIQHTYTELQLSFFSPIPTHRINNQITARELRVVSADGKNLGIISREDALKMAQERGVDLVEIASSATPPVARLIEYGKVLYQEAKEGRKRRAKERKDVAKGIRLTINTSEHDLGIKAEKAREFLAHGFRVDITIRLRGRERFVPGTQERVKTQMDSFLALLPEGKTTGPLRRAPRGFTLAVEKKK